MSEMKRPYIVSVWVPEKRDALGDVEHEEIVCIEPTFMRLTASEAKPINIIARDEVHKHLTAIPREEVMVAIQEVSSSAPFCAS